VTLKSAITGRKNRRPAPTVWYRPLSNLSKPFRGMLYLVKGAGSVKAKKDLRASPVRTAPELRRTHGISLPAAAHALHFYGAAAIALCGWAFSRLLGFACESYAPLWFAGALLVYNIDRLKHDPSDAVNTPLRQATVNRLRRISAAVIAAAALTLVGLPLLRGDWLLLALTVSGAVVCANYSLSPFGFRLKDIPLLKTFLAPSIVIMSFAVPPLLQGGFEASRSRVAIAFLWLWLFLTFNMILCDLRDIAGDSLAGTKSLPVILGRTRTLLALRLLLCFTLGIGLTAGMTASSPTTVTAWLALSVTTAVYECFLLGYILDRPTDESFYEWWVEGMLFIPPVIISLPISILRT
jgi:4-hydroxybenzoate polyprenyltransferase